MSIHKNLAAAALAGLMSSAFIAPAFAADHDAAMMKAEKSESAKEKHACKGLNSCKGNSPEGKNSCKGQSSCATDGSK